MRASSLGGTLRGDPGRTEPDDQAHAGAVGTRHRQRQLEVPFLHEVGVRPTSARFNGTLHGFLMLNPICGAAALKQTIHVLRKAPGTS